MFIQYQYWIHVQVLLAEFYIKFFMHVNMIGRLLYFFIHFRSFTNTFILFELFRTVTMAQYQRSGKRII